METIGFKNFKKYKNFPPLSLSPITFLVGENNSGKSTVIKGLLAFKSLYIDGTVFSPISRMKKNKDNNNTNHWSKQVKNLVVPLNEIGLGTFKRIKNKKSDSDTVAFYSLINGNIFVSINLKENTNNDNCASLSFVYCFDTDKETEVYFDFENDIASFKLNKIDIEKLDKEGYKDGKYYEDTAIPFYCHYLVDKDEFELLFSLSNLLQYGDEEMGHNDNTLTSISTLAFVLKWGLDDLCDIIKDEHHYLKEIVDWCSNFLGVMYEIDDIKNIEYIQVHQITHNNIINNRDFSNYVCSTINEFYYSNIQTWIKSFIKHWMSEFEIGENYEIINLEGEANIVKIIDKNGKKQNLADKGAGSIQIMTMLFRMAIILSENSECWGDSSRDYSINTTLIILEEPEQNLHPRLQSKLADFFYETNLKFNFRFVIETHSEYIIRKTQVIVNKNLGNPFAVYYFRSNNEKEPYYEIKYADDGNFLNEFETGFFDESTKLLYDIL